VCNQGKCLMNDNNSIFSTKGVKLAAGIRLRREYFGGIVYDTRNGNMLEVSKELYHFLDLIQNKPCNMQTALECVVKNRHIDKLEKAKDTIQTLCSMNIIETVGSDNLSEIVADKKTQSGIDRSWISAPETVHWAVTYKCSQACPDCYTQRFLHSGEELDTRRALAAIDRIVQWGVFQLAIGGGEPFERNDLPELVRYASHHGLSVHITTGKITLDRDCMSDVLPFVKNMQIGIHHDALLSSNTHDYVKQLSDLFDSCREYSIIPGANVIVTRSVLEHFHDIMAALITIGFKRIVLLRYKPPEKIARWKDTKPDACRLKNLHILIGNIVQKYPSADIRVDCALSFTQRHLSNSSAVYHGIKGCVAADRIVALTPDGNMYPCSQLIHEKGCAGNILEEDPAILWDTSKALRTYRSFRMKKAFNNSWCGVCAAKDRCGGCRVFAMDGIGGDPGCPETLVPSLQNIGKIGRRLDLMEYGKKNHSISAGEYMRRYGVGQKTAIKELNAHFQTVSTSVKSARKKQDTYKFVVDDIISDIQDSIGCTRSGVPFCSYEEIAKAVGHHSYTDNYPEWIRNKQGQEVVDV